MMPGGDEWEVEVLVENSRLANPGGEEDGEWKAGLEMIVHGWSRKTVRVSLADVHIEGRRRVKGEEVQWKDDRESLEIHETPRWWNEAKFGIFVHWGVYAVPAWVRLTHFYKTTEQLN